MAHRPAPWRLVAACSLLLLLLICAPTIAQLQQENATNANPAASTTGAVPPMETSTGGVIKATGPTIAGNVDVDTTTAAGPPGGVGRNNTSNSNISNVDTTSSSSSTPLTTTATPPTTPPPAPTTTSPPPTTSSATSPPEAIPDGGPTTAAPTDRASPSPSPTAAQVDGNLATTATSVSSNNGSVTTPIAPTTAATQAAATMATDDATTVAIEPDTATPAPSGDVTSKVMTTDDVTTKGLLPITTGKEEETTLDTVTTVDVTTSVASQEGSPSSSTSAPVMTSQRTLETSVTNVTSIPTQQANATVNTMSPPTLPPSPATPLDDVQTTVEILDLTTESPQTTTTTRVTTEVPDPCASVPCQNGASCEGSGDGVSYACRCAAGWTGQQCTEDIDECASSPCANGAPCENGPNYFRCNCPPGYTGKFCDNDIDFCAGAPCLNGGSCTDMVVGFSCTCPVGYSGDTCQTDIDDCLNSPCMNNGSCVDGINMYTCDCGPYWTGDTCQEDIDECSLSPIPDCDPRSTCSNSEGGYTCMCPAGYTGNGATCQFIDLCADSPCAHGVCLSQMLNFTCICDQGWTGANCTQDIDECRAVIGECDATYGDCINTPGGFRCQCQPGTRGNGVICFRETIYSLGTDSKRYSSDTERSAVFQVPGGLPYFGSRYYKVYASIDGHVSFSQDYLPPNPPGGANPVFPPKTAVVAPWWTDLDTTSGPGALWVDLYEPSDRSGNFDNISADVRKNAGDVNLTYALVFTWKEVEPYPSYVSAGSKENATFQLVLATTNEQSFGMFNYNPDGPWLNMEATERRFLIGYSFGNGSDVQIDLLGDTPGYQSNIGHDGRYFFTFGEKMLSPDLSCLTWYRGQRSQPRGTVTPPCPCTLAQANLDTRFMVNTATGCAEGVFADESGGKQKCCYDSMGAIHTSYPYGGYPMRVEDTDARAACCEITELCHLFYELRPSDDCRTYKPPIWALAWGIGHYQTVNSEQLTFNNRGLFNLFDQSTFTLQGRTDLVPSLVTDLMTTALVAVACKTPNSSTVEVTLGAGGSLITMVDGLPAQPGLYPRIYLAEIGDDTVLVQFASGEAVLVTAVEDVLRVRLSVPEVLPGTKGLFTATPGGTQQQLSQYAAIADGGALFMNKNFSFTDYAPADLSATIEQLKNRAALNDSEPAGSCDQIEQCLYDYVATGGDIYRGVSAITERTVMLEHRRRLDNMPPVFSGALPVVLRVNKWVNPIIINVAAADPEGDHSVYNLSTNINTSDYIFLDSGYFRWEPTEINTSIYIRFTASDKEGASTIYWPELRFCDCAINNVHSCDFDYINILGSKSNDDRYYAAECPCLPGYTGRTCSEAADMCDPDPCYTSPATNSCTTAPGALPHGVSCAPCPQQLTGDGLRCYDENECLRGTSKCSHICVNQPGSYTCHCPTGYQLTDDDVTCQDTDECTLGEHNCRGIGEYCSNIPGSFSCECKGTYYRQNNTCMYAPYRFGGQVTYQALQLPSGETLTWSPSLEEKDSGRYKTEATIIEDWLTDYYKKEPGFKACQVTQFSKGSTIAEYNLNMDQPLNISTTATDFSTYLEAQSCTMSGPACTVGQLVGVDISRSYPIAKDLCESDNDNDCDVKSTRCSSYSNGTYSCSCRTGFKKWLDINTICQDINECEGVHNCSVETQDCVNTCGGYTCECKQSYRTLNGKCVPACVPNPCEHNGECFPDVSAASRYTCRCKGFWSGPDCSVENKQARKLEQILIGVGVALGLLCLILLIIIIITCIRCRSRGSHNDSSDMETISDKKVNDRVRNTKRTYSTAGEVGLDSWENNTHVGAAPAAHHLRTTQFEMTENGSKQNLLSGGKEEPYSPRHADTPSTYGSNGAGSAPAGAGSMGVENPSYAGTPSDGGANKLDSQYF